LAVGFERGERAPASDAVERARVESQRLRQARNVPRGQLFAR
jgi:hypothetical protein